MKLIFEDRVYCAQNCTEYKTKPAGKPVNKILLNTSSKIHPSGYVMGIKNNMAAFSKTFILQHLSEENFQQLQNKRSAERDHYLTSRK